MGFSFNFSSLSKQNPNGRLPFSLVFFAIDLRE